MITNDTIILGLLLALLAAIMWTSRSEKSFWKTLYRYCPPLLLCYFIPALLSEPFHLIDTIDSQLYMVASRYFLPAALVLFCLTIDLRAFLRLGKRAVGMLLVATASIIIGGPLALWLFTMLWPDVLADGETWRALTTIAGSWIGGAANQAAMKEIYQVDNATFAAVLVVDVLLASTWMGVLLFGAGRRAAIDRFLRADNSPIKELENKMEDYRRKVSRQVELPDTMALLGIAFGGTAIAHLLANQIVPFLSAHEVFLEQWNLTALNSHFFWLVLIATSIGLLLSFTRIRRLEGVGASRIGGVFIYFLIATIGMGMSISHALDNWPLLVIALIWMLSHVFILLFAARLWRVPFFFVAVGSQANIGGAASAPVVASAFNPVLTPVGALMAVVGYALGTYGAILCAQLMRYVSL